MKFAIIPFLLLITHLSFGQKKIVFVDSAFRFPIEHVHVFSSNKSLLAISNSKGEVLMHGKPPYVARANGYYEFNILELKDTIALSEKIRLIDEVQVKPIEISQFYQNLLDSSNRYVLEDTNTFHRVVYFESVLVIDLNTNDSLFQTKECQLEIHKGHNPNSIDYELYLSGGKKSYWMNTQHGILDTSDLEKAAAIIPKFESFLEHDLTKRNKFSIDFKGNKVSRDNSIIRVISPKKSSIQKNDVHYENGLITSWAKSNLGECTNSEMFCFEMTSKTLEFYTAEDGYYLTNGYVYGIIHMQPPGRHYLIKLKKGFVQNDSGFEGEFEKISNVEDYFKTINYNENKDLIHFYLFP